MAELQSFLALEGELTTRLREQLAAAGLPKVHVLGAADLAGVTEEKQLVPAVHLVFQDYSVLESRADGTAARIGQTWLAVVTTRNTRALKTGAAARAEAGPLALLVARALMGWQPPSAAKRLQLVQGPGMGFNAGFAYLPLAVQTEILIKPEPA